jgi:alcohol dehydrogenase
MSEDAERVSGHANTSRFAYEPPVLRIGAGAVGELEAELAEQGFERALVICGQTVGSTPAVVDPVRDGLGDRLAGIFAETTPHKRLGTAIDGVEALRGANADVIVGLGGGSSLDTATVVSVLAAAEHDPPVVGREFAETGTITVPESGLVPIVAIPTTLAGADCSMVAGVTADPETCPVESPESGGVSGPGLMPAAVHADPELVATTPRSTLAASAMNGFDKGIETLYASTASPVTDATAMRGLSVFHEGLLAFGEADDPSLSVYEQLVEGATLVQYGISRTDETTLSLIHAAGHGLTRTYPVQQGAAHAVVAPHALRWLFNRIDGRRELLARAFGVEDAADPADAVVAAVENVIAALELPTRLRDVDGPTPDEFPAVAEDIRTDGFMPNAPAGLDPTNEAIAQLLEAAW